MIGRMNFFRSFTGHKQSKETRTILKGGRKQDLKKVQQELNTYRSDFGLLRITLKNVEAATASIEAERGQIDIFESDIEIAKKIIELFPERANKRGLYAKAYQHLATPPTLPSTKKELPAKPKTINIFANAMKTQKARELAALHPDQELSFTIKSYAIEAGIYNGSIAMTCDCPVRRSRQVCKHQLALLSDDPVFQTAAKAKRVYVPQNLTSENMEDVEILRSWLLDSKLEVMLKNLAMLEQQKKRDKDPKPTKKQRITMYFELGGE